MKKAKKTTPEIERFCRFCGNATPLEDSDTMLCNHRGIVRADYCCGKFTYDPLKREPTRMKKEVKLDYVEL